MCARRAAITKSGVIQFRSPAEEADRERFDETIGYFRKYGSKYDFDPLLLAAQGFQESQLDQNARSHVGAVGIMQIMPATCSSLGVGSIHMTESNIPPAPSTWIN